GVLAWTAVKMMTGEPLVKEWLAQRPLVAWAAYIAVIGGVLSSGFMANHAKIRARVASRLVEVKVKPVPASAGMGIANGDKAMVKVLIPVDGSANSQRAVQHVVNRFI